MHCDGVGYGISHYWDYTAKSIMKNSEELCVHDNVKAKFISDSTKPFFIDAHIECNECEKKFPKSEEKLLDEYLKFYGMKV